MGRSRNFPETAHLSFILTKALFNRRLERFPRAKPFPLPAASSANRIPLLLCNLLQQRTHFWQAKFCSRGKPHSCQSCVITVQDVLRPQVTSLFCFVRACPTENIAFPTHAKSSSLPQYGQYFLHPSDKVLIVATPLEQRGTKQMVSSQAHHASVTILDFFSA